MVHSECLETNIDDISRAVMCNHRPDDGECLLKSLVERCVLGVDHHIRARLNIGHPGGVVETDDMEIVSAGSPVDTCHRRHHHGLLEVRPSLLRLVPLPHSGRSPFAGAPHIPSRPTPKVRCRATSASWPAWSGRAPGGIPTSTSMMTSRIPAR